MSIEAKFGSIMDKNKKELIQGQILKIGEEVDLKTNKHTEKYKDMHLYQNTMGLVIGKPGSGKTLGVIYDLTKCDGFFNRIIYVTREDKVDKTFESFIPMVKTKIFHVVESNFEDYIITYVENLDLLIKIRAGQIKMNKQVKKQFILNLELTDEEFKSKEQFKTFILFEDASDSPLFKKGNDFFVQLMRIFRHYFITSIAIVHSFKFFPIHLREYIFTINIFKGFSKLRMNQIYHQTNLEEEFKDLWTKYKKLKMDIANKYSETLIIDSLIGRSFVKIYDFNK